jgi:NifU-like protein involved in Fe-S cluster formation
MSVADLFERGFRRNRAAPLAIEGMPCTDSDGNGARFSLSVADGKIAGVGFHVSSCATLVAYCEFIAEIVPGFGLDIAQALAPANLVEGLPGVPVLKRDRAVLAIAGFRAALAVAATSARSPTSCFPACQSAASQTSIRRFPATCRTR